ncbi:AarF/UbiB family protein [Microbacter sp. GSS18]|nr:AarF/UbiB family protein [Microbacter sp. GSS18]
MTTDARAARARYRRIMRFAWRYMVQAWWFELFLPRVGLGPFAARGRSERMRRIARNFHDVAVELGGLMIKVGQFMSSRLDVLPPEITSELESLQDEVPPVDFAAIRSLAESELGRSLDHAFASVDPAPLAAASLGQAHRATLLESDADDTGFAGVVVKIQRPGIEDIVAIDLTALRRVARLMNRVRIVRQHVDLPALIEEFAATSLEEIDYIHEAANAARFAEDFAGDPRVRVPEVAWERSTRRVLTLQDVSAIKINDHEALRAAGIDPSEVARVFADVMFDQMFAHGYFHADPHPGNLFVTPTPEAADGPGFALTFVDFGMMGQVPDRLRSGMRQLMIAVAGRDSRQLVGAIRDMGVLLPTADTGELEHAMRELFSRFGGMAFSELQQVDVREFEDFAVEFGETMRSMPFQLPENFLLIIRAVSLTSGLCSSLDPAFNVWDAAEPYAQQLLREERGNIVQSVAKEVSSVAGIVARLPRRVDDLVTKLDDGKLAVDMSSLDRRFARLERLARRGVWGAVFGSLLVGGALLYGSEAAWGTTLMLLSIPPGLAAIFSGVGRRGPR